MTTLRLWLLLRRRASSTSDPVRLTGVLAVVAFAVTTAVALLVIGGWFAFQHRDAEVEGSMYPMLAGVAAGLLLVPLAVLGGAAARLAVARRDARLASLRLAGATSSQVSALTVLESASQAGLGAILGVIGFFGLIPAVLPVVFQGEAFTYRELIPPVWVIAAAPLAVVGIAVLSAGASLRRIVITPLGVANRATPNPLHWSRLIPLAVAIAGFAVAWSVPELVGFGVLLGFVLLGVAAVNAIGPLVLGGIGRGWARRARTADSLIAARRLADDPKTAWRSVGGVGLATFVAGLTAATAMFGRAAGDADPEGAMLFGDIGRGGMLTLAIAGVVAGVSTGVLQSGRVIDQRTQYRALHLAGFDLRHLNAARIKEVRVPLVVAIVIGGATSGVFQLIALGSAPMQSLPVLAQFLACVAAAALLVLAGSAASSRVVRTVIA